MSMMRSAGGRRPRLVAVVLATCLAGPAVAGAEPAVPDGYRVASHQQLAPGVEHLELRRDADPQAVHVARLRPSDDVSLRVVLAGDRVGSVERPDSMCLRVDCIVAVNGDFYEPANGEPIGGVVIDGQMLKSPVPSHHQLSIAPDGSLAAGTLEATARFVASDLQELRIDGVNTERLDDRVVLFTPAHGATTRTNQYGTELIARVVEPAPPLLLGQTAMVELVELREGQGDSPVPADGLVLSGHGAGAQLLTTLWTRAGAGEVGRRGLLRLEITPSAAQSIGGSPVLVREGRRWVGDDGSGFVNGRHPRTIVGWTADGEVLLVTVDGRQPGYSGGMTLPEAAELLLALGAEEAINLDGGGSTSFVVRGQVANQPSDRLVRRGGTERLVHVPARGDTVVGNVQRPVAVGLAVVARAQAGPGKVDPLARASAGLPRRVPLPPPADDPGSAPGASLPALVATLPAPPRTGLRLAVAVTLTGLLATAATAVTVRARWRRRLALAVQESAPPPPPEGDPG